MPDSETVEIEDSPLAELSVCEGCCCGVTSKGNAAVPVQWLKAEWEHRSLSQSVELTIRYCLGRCKDANIAAITSETETLWLSGLNAHRDYRLLVEWAEKCKHSDQLVSLPTGLRSKLSPERNRTIPARKEQTA